MITVVGHFAKARCYVVQTREYSKRRRNPEAGWTHCGQFNYDGKYITKDQAKNRAELFSANKEGLYDDFEFRVVNMTVKQAHKEKTKSYRACGDLAKLKAEFSYDKKCSRHPTIPHVPNKRRRDEKLGTTALTTPETNHTEKNTRDYQRLRKAMAYYEFANNL